MVRAVEILIHNLNKFMIACLALLLVACNGETLTPSSSPTTTFDSPVSVLPTPNPTVDRYTKSYTTTMELPDGRDLPMYCRYTGMDSQCRVVFPNGEIMPATNSPAWSPDGKFALVCGSYTSHDTSCSLYGLCDLVHEECGNYDVSVFHKWKPGSAHTLAYFYLSSYLGKPDHVVILDPETGVEEILLEACPDWFGEEFAWSCERLPNAIVGGHLADLPDGAEAQIMISNIDGNNHFGPMTWRKSGGWHGNLKNSPGKLYEVTVEAEGYTSVPLSYTIQVSGTKAYVLDAGQPTGEVADHLDFRFEKRE